MSIAGQTHLLTSIFCALQEGDYNGILPGALLQRARRERESFTPENAAWLANLESAWATQNAYTRWEG